MSLVKRLGTICLLIVIIFGSYCLMNLIKKYNIRNLVLGYFEPTNTITKINDFEYDFDTMLFTNSGVENEYFSIQNAEKVIGYDRTKKYVITINDIETNLVSGNFNYINCNFTNKFNSSQDTVLLTDTLNIKVNFYTNETKIMFTTHNGEQAVKLWSSYIKKNGFKLKIKETTLNLGVTVDSFPDNKTLVNYYINDELYSRETYSINEAVELKTYSVEEGYKFVGWFDTKLTYDSSPLELPAFTELTFTESKMINLYGYTFEDHSIVIKYKNNTNSRIDVDLVKLVYSTSGGKTTYSIKETYWSSSIPIGEGIITYDNTGIWGPFSLLFNDGEKLNIEGSLLFCSEREISINETVDFDYQYSENCVVNNVVGIGSVYECNNILEIQINKFYNSPIPV